MKWLSNLFGRSSKKSALAAQSAEITGDFNPAKGTFLRTLEFPETDAQGNVTGKTWMEAGFVPDNKAWVLWQKSIRTMDDVLRGGQSSVLSARPLIEKTTFVNAYDQMTTFETAQRNLGGAPLPQKTRAKLGGDYYKQFAWREGLMMTRSGRLFPFNADTPDAAGHFDAQDIADSQAFHERLRREQFVPVPIVLPAIDWEKAYNARRGTTDQRLNALIYRYNNDIKNYDLALQIVAHEQPEVLYAYMQRGGNLKSFEPNTAQHMGIIRAALARAGAETMELVVESGLSFSVRDGLDTPVELAVSQKRYAHLHLMLSRDGVALANFADANGIPPAIHAMESQDRQAFRMLYLEGLDFSLADKNGWHLIHHAFANDFIPGVYAWLDDNLPIDMPVAGTAYTGISIARDRRHAAIIDFAIKNGANANAPAIPAVTAAAPIEKAPAPVAPVPAPAAEPVKIPAFSIDLLNGDVTNDTIEQSARAYAATGGTFNGLDARGASLFELCWKNRKESDAARDRRALLPVFAALGADAAAQLTDGTTALTRAASGIALDMDYVRALAPLARDVNNGDAQGNNILHAVQLNRNDAVGHSSNVAALLKLFPALDVDRVNNDGLSNAGLAIRLNRSQTLKAFAAANLSQNTASGTSYLAMAFTRACGEVAVTGAPRATAILETSPAVREAVLTLLEKPGADTAAITKDLLDTMVREQAPAAMIQRLKSLKL